MELETDGYTYGERETVLAKLNSFQRESCEFPTFWLKGDGSLDHGVEICFHPRTPASWAKFLVDGPFQEMKNIIELHGGKAYDTSTAGLHIHRENEGITPVLRAKLCLFISQCKSPLQKIAQRRSNSYCSIGRFNAKTVENARSIAHSTARMAITPNSHHNTIEFRLFKGTLAPRTLAAQVGFVDALLLWLASKSSKRLNELAQHKDAMWESFMLHLDKSQHEAIPFIHELLARKKFFTLATTKRELPDDVVLPTLPVIEFDGTEEIHVRHNSQTRG